jgi:hypothetical protein
MQVVFPALGQHLDLRAAAFGTGQQDVNFLLVGGELNSRSVESKAVNPGLRFGVKGFFFLGAARRRGIILRLNCILHTTLLLPRGQIKPGAGITQRLRLERRPTSQTTTILSVSQTKLM